MAVHKRHDVKVSFLVSQFKNALLMGAKSAFLSIVTIFDEVSCPQCTDETIIRANKYVDKFDGTDR